MNLLSASADIRARLRRAFARSRAPDAAERPGRYGVDDGAWRRAQAEHELDYWMRVFPGEVPSGQTPERFYALHYHRLNARMFRDPRLDCFGRIVLDVGCGPFGSLPYRRPRVVLGIDPLAAEYQRRFRPPSYLTFLTCRAESVPLADASVDAVYCVNALDHFARPYEALDEFHRVLRPGGYLALAVDLGDTPRHPCSLVESDLRAALGIDADPRARGAGARYRVIECRSGTDIVTSWPASMRIPAFVFQGEKLAARTVRPAPRAADPPAAAPRPSPSAPRRPIAVRPIAVRPSAPRPARSGRRIAPRGIEPLCRRFGLSRGTPVDRYYIEQFLAAHAGDVRGAVLEVGDRSYTRRFGAGRVVRSDVLSREPGPAVTLAADLADPAGIGEAAWDCIILTQTLPFIFDVRAALRNCRRALRQGGALLLTVPGIAQISRYDMERWGDFWRFTPACVARLLDDCFGPAASPDACSAAASGPAAPREPAAGRTIEVFGNVRAAAALLEGLAAEELTARELEHHDADYPVIVAARVVRSA